MTCREFVEFLDRYLSGELAPDEAAEFERHLAVCDACVAYVDSYRQTVGLLQRQKDEKVPDEVPEELVAAILAARKKKA